MSSHFRKCKTLSDNAKQQKDDLKDPKEIEQSRRIQKSRFESCRRVLKVSDSRLSTRKSNSIKIKDVIINYSFNKSTNDSLKPTKITAKMRWRKVMNLIKAINRMKTFEIHEIHSLRDIDVCLKHMKDAVPQGNLDNYFTSRENNDDRNRNSGIFNERSMREIVCREDTIVNLLSEYALNSEAMKLAEIGDGKAIARLKTIIMSDPKRNLFSKSEKRRYFVNQPNTEGFTLIYQACFNGNLNVVRMLLDCDADHLIRCGNSSDEKLSILDVIVRWNHLKLTQYLLLENEYKLDWPKEYIVSALKIAVSQNNKNMIKLLKSVKTMKSGSCCFFICN